jgi:glycerophosphoryl diester phosphodiesterase
MAGLDWLTARPIAHRGLHDTGNGVIENTLSAARAAIDGNYAIEIDVQPDRDLVPVVFHDATLERLTEASRPVAAYSAAELAEVPFKDTTDRIPTLKAYLEAVNDRVPVIIEVKTDSTGMPDFCARIAAVLTDYKGRVAVMSFDPEAVAAFRRIAPALPRGIVAESFRRHTPKGTTWWDRFRLRHLLHAGRTRPQFISYRVVDLPAAAPLVLHWMFGLPLITWTVRTEEQRRRSDRWADQITFEGFRA